MRSPSATWTSCQLLNRKPCRTNWRPPRTNSTAPSAPCSSPSSRKPSTSTRKRCKSAAQSARHSKPGRPSRRKRTNPGTVAITPIRLKSLMGVSISTTAITTKEPPCGHCSGASLPASGWLLPWLLGCLCCLGACSIRTPGCSASTPAWMTSPKSGPSATRRKAQAPPKRYSNNANASSASTYRCSTTAAKRWSKAPSPPRAAPFEPRHSNEKRLPWRRLSVDYTSPHSGETYLFIYRIPNPEVAAWQRESLLWPLSALAIAMLVLTLFSLWLTLSITRPLNRLRGAVHDLGQTAYQQNSLAKLAERRD